MQNIDSDLIRGNIDTIILKTMLNEDKYGLDIIKEVSDKSNGTYELKQPTLYSCLKRLENQGLISSYWVDSEIGGKRHYYKLTDKGREFYNKKQEEWAKSKFIIDNLLSNFNYEEYRLVKKDEFDKIIQNKADAPLSSFSETSNNSADETNNSDLEHQENSFEHEETENSEDFDNYKNQELDSDISSDFENQNSFDTEKTYEQDDENLEENSETDTDVENVSFNDYTVDSNSQSEPDTQLEDEDYENEDGSSFNIHEVLKNSDDFDSTENAEDEEYENESDFYSNDNETNQTDLKDDEIFSLGTSEENNNFTDEDSQTEITQNTDDEDYPVYFSAKQSEKNYENENKVSYETSDQSSNELNILNRLRGQEDETINTYYGDQKSYVNHLNQLDDSQIEQQDLLDSSLYVKPDLVNKSIDEFSNAVEKLNNFSSASSDDNADFDNETSTDDEISDENEEFETQENDNLQDYEAEDNDDLSELENLKNISSNDFFNSNDNADYDKQTTSELVSNHDYDYSQTDSSDASFDDNDYEPENTAPMSFNEIANEANYLHYDDTSYANSNDETVSSETEQTQETSNDYNQNLTDEQSNMNDIDSIISNNISTNYVEPTQAFYRNQTSNYREKLSNLSKYSRVTLDDEQPKQSNEEAIEKAKDIAEITKELEEEGIKVKEHYKQTNSKALDKNYLLCNKINLMRSLIMFFGYVFILSAVYIVLNNTQMKENSWFGFKPFLIGFIPFAVILAYYTILFIINPYKKVDAKFHFRIMLFISVIITIQLLLITYCINLQLGFYSFSQKEYNHLLWIIPTIISFAPIIDNFVYLALFKSKNFNV